MGYVLLTAGVLLWAYSHLMKRLTPGLRARMGENGGKMAVSVMSIIAIYLMVKGYGRAAPIDLWNPPAFMTHINNTLMLIAVFLLGLGYSRGVLRSKMRHPMLGAVKVWALAHLLVNGDLASVILFGGLLAWAVVDMIMINRQTPPWVRPAAGPVINDVLYGVISLLVFGVIAYVHLWLGVSPFGG
ncbi:NnrU family protein [Pararhodobacter sp.]|uniref:NnrU family protein n=1 Tax=Pararhodobacter sp. TaxID=2127056 RepID=UPI002AFE3FA1|nr:NnrU family protein [Pararhodobacter sp.]